MITSCLLAGVLLAAAFFEIIPENLVRGGKWEGPLFEPDSVSGYRFKPGEHVCSSLFNFKVNIVIGEDGFRCSLPLDETSGKDVRVIMLGHSQPFCVGCDEQDALHNEFTRIMKEEKGIDSVCYNLSLPRSPLSTNIELLKTYGETLRPTHVFYWGPRNQETDRAWESEKASYKDNLRFGYFANGWVGPLADSRVLKYSLLARWMSSRTFWKNVRSADVLPWFFDNIISRSFSEANARGNSREPVSERRVDMDYSELQSVCDKLGARLLINDARVSGEYKYPTDHHLTPAGAEIVSRRLADRVVSEAK